MALLIRNVLNKNRLVVLINYNQNQNQTYTNSVKCLRNLTVFNNRTSLLLMHKNKSSIRLSSSEILGQQNRKSTSLTKKLFLGCLAAFGISGLCLHLYSDYVLVDFNEKNQFNVSF
jgi:hypothetical protein